MSVARFKLVDEEAPSSLFDTDVDPTPDEPDSGPENAAEEHDEDDLQAAAEPALEASESVSVATAESNPEPFPPQVVEASPRHTQGNVYDVVVYVPGPLFLRLKHDKSRQMMLVHSFDPTPDGGEGPVEATHKVSIGDIFLSINDVPIDTRSLKAAATVIKNVSVDAAENGVPRVLRFLRARTPAGQGRKRFIDPEKERARLIQQVCSEKLINEGRLRNLATQGIPEQPPLRGMVWRILLRYLPLDTTQWPTVLEQQRKLYAEWVEELLTSPAKACLRANGEPAGSLANAASRKAMKLARQRTGDDPLNTGTASEWARYWADLELLEEIEKDVIRTHPEIQFFLEDHDHVRYNAMQRALFIYAKLHPGVRYVQGMNELLGTLYYVFATDPVAEWAEHAEVDAFFCFSNLMLEVQDVFIRNLDDSSSGIQGRISELSHLLHQHDPELHQHLAAQQLEPSYYALRWITTLLSREFNLPDTIRVWDSLFADTSRHDFLVYTCCTMLILQRHELLQGDFVSNLRLLQSYPSTDVQVILERSTRLRTRDSYHKIAPETAQQHKEINVMSQLSEFVQRTLAATQDAYGKVASFHAYLEEGERGTLQNGYATLASWWASGAGHQQSPQQPARQQDYIHLKRTRRKSGEGQPPGDTMPRNSTMRQPTPPGDTPDQSDNERTAESDREDNVSFIDGDDDENDDEDDEDAGAAAQNDAGQRTHSTASLAEADKPAASSATAGALLGLDVSPSVDTLISELDGILGLSADKDASLEGGAPKHDASESNA